MLQCEVWWLVVGGWKTPLSDRGRNRGPERGPKSRFGPRYGVFTAVFSRHRGTASGRERGLSSLYRVTS